MTDLNPTHKILIAEDDPTIQRLYEAILSPIARVTLVKNGKEAKDLLSQGSNYHLIITDREMPVMCGLKLLTSIQHQTTPRLMISGTSTPHDLHLEVRQYGALGLYQKPFPIQEFRTIASEFLSNGNSPTLEAYFNSKYVN